MRAEWPKPLGCSHWAWLLIGTAQADLTRTQARTHTHACATDRCGPDFVGSAYRFYGETCSRCALIVTKPGEHGLGARVRFDRECGADHYDQLKIALGREPRVAHVGYTGYRHPFRKYKLEPDE